MKYYNEPLSNQNEMGPDVKALLSGGTNDKRGSGGVEYYFPKYNITVSEKQFSIPRRVGYAPNIIHTTQTPEHSIYWRMWLAHCFLGRPLSNIDTVRHYRQGANIIVEATVSGEPIIESVYIWYTNQNDFDTSAWDGFAAEGMFLDAGVYRGQIPGDTTAYYVEVLDTADGVSGIICSTPQPVNRDYPLLHLAPGNIGNFQATADGENNQIDLNWINPQDEDYAGVIIRYQTTNYPVSPLDGTLLYDGGATAAIHSGVTAGTTYYYAAFSYDQKGDYSSAATIQATAAGVPLTGDVNGDGVVNILDLILLAINFGSTTTPEYDINDDGIINILDLIIVAINFGRS